VLIAHIKNINKKDCHTNNEKKSLFRGDSRELITFSVDIKYISLTIVCYNERISRDHDPSLFLIVKMVPGQPAMTLMQIFSQFEKEFLILFSHAAEVPGCY